jgi:integrase
MPPKINLAEVIGQQLLSRGLSQSSINLYLRNLKKLNGGNDFSSLTFLKDVNGTLEKINDLKDNTRRQYLISIVSSLNSFGDKYKALSNKYYKLMIETAKKISETPSIEPSEAQKENWMEWVAVLETYNSLKNSLNLSKKKLTEGEYNKLLEYVVLSLFVLTPPRRNMDYLKMCISFKNTTAKDCNYFDPKTNKFIFNVYKTDNKYGEQVIDVPKDLLEVLVEYMRFHPLVKKKNPENVPLLVNYSGQPFKAQNAITRILNKIFKKNISSSMLRHIFLSSKYGNELKEREKDASLMAHSVQQQTGYIKDV